MSTPENHTLTDYTPSDTRSKRTWQPEQTARPRRCLGCGAHVTRRFQRTHGNNNGDIHGCLECLNRQVPTKAYANPNQAARFRDRLNDRQRNQSGAGGHPAEAQQ